ncbi:unnamed protein product [Echinostoma caproni]|uniref:Deacetylase sirtuin-type domain-containing protein n=1 Tax=Echinostoma caproni TaxID=27848 RepID=A0A3P8FVY9_9TREM|nr:unnamed protein product [Echinostoma caproni]
MLEAKNKLLRNYTQNIDTLEQAAGITRLIQCHGSFASASCTSCKYRVPGIQIKDAIFAQKIPYCPRCRPKEAKEIASATNGTLSSPQLSEKDPITNETGDHTTNRQTVNSSCAAFFGVLKPDIVFFGEDLSSEFHNTLASDVKEADLVLVMGSSLKVRPVSHIPNSIPGHVPQILINREPLSNHDFDVELLGDCDVIVSELCTRLGWELDNGLGPVAAEPGTLIPLRQLWENRMKKEEMLQETRMKPIEREEVRTTEADQISSEISPKNKQSPALTDATKSNETKDTTQGAEITDGGSAQCSKNVVEINESDEESDEEEDVWEVAASLPLSQRRANSSTHPRSPRSSSSCSGKHPHPVEPRTPPPTPKELEPSCCTTPSPPPLVNAVDEISEQPLSDTSKVTTAASSSSSLDGPEPKRPRGDQEPTSE